MGIKSPITFGDYYWAKQVEAAELLDEKKENLYASYMSGVFSDIKGIDGLPDGLYRFLNALTFPPSPGMGGFALGVGVEIVDETVHTALSPLMKMITREYNRRSKETWLTSAQANLLFSRKKIPEDFWETIIASEGYEDVLGGFLYKSQLPYPSIPDLILYSRYHGDPYNVWSMLQDYYNIDVTDFKLWEWLALQRLTTDQLQTLYKRGLISNTDLVKHLAKVGWSASDSLYIEQLGWSIPNAMLLVQGDLQQQQSRDKIIKDISIADINPQYAETYLDAILTKPSSQDIIAYQLRTNPTLTGLETHLQKIGIHPDYLSLYKTLAYPIPPVADIITMAVREAFTPEIAARFGQYEDYPKPLEDWGVKKGLTPEWTQRYWAAHWSLPSATQGFEMLHRGVISRDELNMLLRALDVMPFWRDKLTSIAYKRLTRVDIRRMYGEGVLTETEVYEAYLDLGYDDTDAKRMTDFTIKQILSSQSKFTANDIVSAYSKYMISRSEARSLLIDIGTRSENIEFILTTAEYKRAWSLTDDRIAAIRNLYKKAVYDDNKARSELLRLDLPAERVDALMAQWYVDEKDKPTRYWTTAQTLSFLKAGLIAPERAKVELYNIGYDTEHVDIYMRSIE